MGILNKVVAGITGGGVKASAEGLSQMVDSMAEAGDRWFTSDEERLAFELHIAELKHKAKELNNELLMIDAKSSSKFQSWWRPFIGWVCAISLLMPFIIAPVVEWVAIFAATGNPPPFMFPMDHIFALITGMGVFGGLRSFDKTQGTAK